MGVIDYSLYLKGGERQSEGQIKWDLYLTRPYWKSIVDIILITSEMNITLVHWGRWDNNWRIWCFSDGNEQMTAVLDQKNYLEELNRHLE